MATAQPRGSVVETFEALTAVLSASTAQVDYPIGELTTYRVGGNARFYIEVESVADLSELCTVARDRDLGLMIIGLGSNLLVPDSGFDGVAIRLGESFGQIEVSGQRCVAGAAASLPRVARQTVAAGLTGFEWAVGVPGSIGGAVRMNAGGHGSDIAASLTTASGVDLTSGEPFTHTNAELAFGYRSSNIGPHLCVTRAELELSLGDIEAGEEQLSSIVRWRREHQPGGQNAGSVFVNPSGDSAGRLIDVSGCKGLRVGSAVVSDKHANFIQVDPDGSADDVLALMEQVVAEVQRHAGVVLVPETRILGHNYLQISTKERGLS